MTLKAARAYGADHAGSYAAAIAYHTLFSILPLSLFVIGVAGYFMTKSQRNELVKTLSEALGGASTANIQRQIRIVTNGRAAISVIGLVVAIWSASAVFGALRTGLEVVWNDERRSPWLKTKLRDFACVLGFGVLLAASATASLFLTAVSGFTHKLFGVQLQQVVAIAFDAVYFILPVSFAFITFGLVYIVAAPHHMNWRDIWPGAVVASIGFQAMSLGFSLYVRSFGRFDKVYGSLGAVIAFLLYAYLLGTLTLFGAEFSKQYMLRRASAEPEAAPQAAHESVAFVARPVRFTEARDDLGDRLKERP
jgi:membrane protein